MGTTGITYGTKNWNVITGCSPDFQCWARCWARKMAKRQEGRNGYPAGDEFRPGTFHKNKLMEPLHWRKPQTVAVNFMGDMFHEAVTDYDLDRQFVVMALTPQHRYLVLTKRPERMSQYIRSRAELEGHNALCLAKHSIPHYPRPHVWPLPNVWLGVTIENQEWADKRIPYLLQTPATVRWVSVEPMLGPVNTRQITLPSWPHDPPGPPECGMVDALTGERWALQRGRAVGRYRDETVHPLNWVVAGCESGPGARSMDENWVRSLRDQCVSAGVPFTYKQKLDERGKKIEYPELDGRVWDQMPQVGS